MLDKSMKFTPIALTIAFSMHLSAVNAEDRMIVNVIIQKKLERIIKSYKCTADENGITFGDKTSIVVIPNGSAGHIVTNPGIYVDGTIQMCEQYYSITFKKLNYTTYIMPNETDRIKTEKNDLIPLISKTELNNSLLMELNKEYQLGGYKSEGESLAFSVELKIDKE
jgi:hypothetical protein